jgi:hypothetical protein
VRRPSDQVERVNEPQDQRKLAAIRQSGALGRPFGNVAWTIVPAETLEIDNSLRLVGRPKTDTAESSPKIGDPKWLLTPFPSSSAR